MEIKKVLQLVEDLKVGGAEKIIAGIAEGLDKKKFEARVWCVARGGEISEELKGKGIDVKILGISSYHNPFNILKLALLLRKAKPDIVHTHGYFASVIGSIAAKIVRIPFIVEHIHTIFYENIKKRNIPIEHLLSLIANKIIFISKASRDSFLPYLKADEDKISVIYNGVGDTPFRANSEELGLRVVTVASLVPHKGHRHLFEAARKILEEIPQSEFYIVGKGPLNKELRQQVSDLGITSSVKFLGQRKDIYDVLSRMNLFVLPSLREGLGIAVLEAMAVGLPAVVTDVGGLPEIVEDGKTGLIVPAADSFLLAKNIIDILKNPEKLKKMGLEGRRRFEEKFRVEKMIEEIENLYLELIEKNSQKNKKCLS